MKKMILCASMVAALISAPVFAGTHGYTTSLHPAATVLKDGKKQGPLVDILVNNFTNGFIYVNVPAGNMVDIVYPGNSEHITNYIYQYPLTEVILADPFHSVFFDGLMCPYAVINAYGAPGSDYAVVNTNYC